MTLGTLCRISGILDAEDERLDLIALTAATPEHACERARRIMAPEFKQRLRTGSIQAHPAPEARAAPRTIPDATDHHPTDAISQMTAELAAMVRIPKKVSQ